MGKKQDADFEDMVDRASFDQWEEADPWDALDATPVVWDPISPPPLQGSLGLKEGFDDLRSALQELRSLGEEQNLSDEQRRRHEHCRQIVEKELRWQSATMRKREFMVGPDKGVGAEMWGPSYQAVKPATAVAVKKIKRRKMVPQAMARASTAPPSPRETESHRILRLAAEQKAKRRAERKAKLPWSTPQIIEVFGAEARAIREALAL